VTIVYSEKHSSSTVVAERERQLKRWTARKKEALIAGDSVSLKRLARCRQTPSPGRTVVSAMDQD
jgi:predicted GIY-YIG superfamily endonuclease